MDCFGPTWFCQVCCVREHKRNPFHHIRHWTGSHFTRITLLDLGFICHLGHNGEPCPAASGWELDHMDIDENDPTLVVEDESESEDERMVFVDHSGVHKHRVRWCACRVKPQRDILLLKMNLFPASLSEPRTAFTFRGLEYFHIDSMECRTSAANYYNKLRRITNPTFPTTVPVSIISTLTRTIMNVSFSGSIPRIDAHLSSMALYSSIGTVRVWA
jgi:hypothetical protein